MRRRYFRYHAADLQPCAIWFHLDYRLERRPGTSSRSGPCRWPSLWHMDYETRVQSRAVCARVRSAESRLSWMVRCIDMSRFDKVAARMAIHHHFITSSLHHFITYRNVCRPLVPDDAVEQSSRLLYRKVLDHRPNGQSSEKIRGYRFDASENRLRTQRWCLDEVSQNPINVLENSCQPTGAASIRETGQRDLIVNFVSSCPRVPDLQGSLPTWESSCRIMT
nr:hypothetical protein CFP56_56013 [Quercus suber]